MADLAAGDVTYTITGQSVDNFSNKNVFATLAFGDGSKTYPSGGIPITLGSLGLPNVIKEMQFIDMGTAGYFASYDLANNKLRLFTGGSHSHSLSLKNAAVADGATTRVNAGTNLLGANTGSDISIAGGGANGGIASASAGVMVELTGGSTAVAATTLKVQASGW